MENQALENNDLNAKHQQRNSETNEAQELKHPKRVYLKNETG